jgi:ribosomal protein L16/L10AE
MIKQFPNKNKFKFNKFHKIKYLNTDVNKKSFFVKFGLYGLQTLNSAKITYKHLETGRIILRKFMKKKGII